MRLDSKYHWQTQPDIAHIPMAWTSWLVQSQTNKWYASIPRMIELLEKEELGTQGTATRSGSPLRWQLRMPRQPLSVSRDLPGNGQPPYATWRALLGVFPNSVYQLLPRKWPLRSAPFARRREHNHLPRDWLGSINHRSTALARSPQLTTHLRTMSPCLQVWNLSSPP